MRRKTLNDILAEPDELGLLANLRPSPSALGTSDQRLRQKLEDINGFIDRHKRLPGDVKSGSKISPSERMLLFALNGIQADQAAVSSLKSFDRHGILANVPAPSRQAESLEEILASDDELLSTPADEIFTFSHAPIVKSRPDRKAERIPCSDFSRFEPLFEECVLDLRSGRRKAREFRNETEIDVGEFFILNGSMLYVAEVNEPHLRGGKANARLRLIFDNGTEGDNLLRSLAAELYKDGPAGRGRRVTSREAGPLFKDDLNDTPTSAMVDAPSVAGEASVHSGHIYIVKSLSKHPEVRKLDGYLYKIGFTTGSVEARIATAKDDPTFLMATAVPVKSYSVVNLNTAKFEGLLHRFFGNARLSIEIADRFGRPYKPREWFLVSLEVVERAVEMLINGSIVRHRYDDTSGKIVSLE